MVVRGWIVGCFAATCLSLFAGCNSGPAIADVTGKVVFQGKPVPEGSVTLANGSNVPFTTSVGQDGSFTVKAVVGRNDVMYSAPTPELGPDVTEKTAPKPSRFEGLQPKEMTVDITGPQEITIELVK